MRLSAPIASLAGALLSATLVAQTLPTGKVWIVSNSGCPLVNFTSIQQAIDAASDGDVILVRPGIYTAGFTIDGKALAIVGDGQGAVGVNRRVEVKNVRSNQRVLLQGMHLGPFGGAALALSANAGPILVEDCTFIGDDFASGVQATATGSAVFSRCSISAGAATSGISFFTTGGSGMQVATSQVTLYETTVNGGQGAQSVDFTVSGGSGGPGLQIDSGVVVLSGSTLRAGNGGNGYSSVFGSLFACTPGGSGGAAVSYGSGSGLASVYQQASSLTGGTGGLGGTALGGSCANGANGAASVGGTPILVSGPAHTYVSQSPVLESQTVPATFTGGAGDTALFAFSLGQLHQLLPGLGGTYVLARPSPTLLAGTLPASGSGTGNVFIPPGLVAPGQAMVLYAQGLFASAQQQAFIGSTQAWVILDQTLDPKDGCP